MGKRRKKKDAGAVIFRLIGIELAVLTVVLAVLGIVYLPGLLREFKGEGRLGFGSRKTDSQDTQANNIQSANTSASNSSEVAPSGSDAQTQAAAEQTQPPEDEEELASVSFVAVGDNLMHRSSTLSGKQTDNTYSFYSNFCNVQDIFQAADIAMISQDTVMAGEEFGVTSGETFNTVWQVADGLAAAGINVVLAANNHILDMGRDGLINMIDYFRANFPEVALLGVNRSAEEKEEPVYLEQNGIKLAFVNYTCNNNKPEPLETEPFLLNQKDDAWLEEIIGKARSEADFVVVCPHWGTQNSLDVTQEQEEQAQLLADLGADLIIGAYPHVVEPVRWVTGKDGRQTLVYYSLGNFQSIQDKTENMLGGLAKITLTKTNYRTYISDCDLDFVVTHYAQQSSSEYFDIVTTFPWSEYTESLAQMHGILAWDPGFSYSKLEELRNTVLEQCEFSNK